MGSKAAAAGAALACLLTAGAGPALADGVEPDGAPSVRRAAPWTAGLGLRLEELGRVHGGRVAVLVRDLGTGETVTLDADETCYLASGVKIPIALEVLRRVDEGTLSLETRVRLERDHLVDGSPRSASREPGSLVSLGDLLDDMITWSDNTASDLLIREVGLDSVNARLHQLVPEGFSDVTTLADVRRLVYSCLFPDAVGLTNREIADLKDVADDEARLEALARLLRVEAHEACAASVDAAYEEYYACGYNSATLDSYARLLEAVASGRALQPRSTALLLESMQRVHTGTRRIQAGLPEGIAWAHKTGTQHERVADFGLAWRRDEPDRKLVIAAVAAGFRSQARAEAVLRQVGEAVHRSGALDPRGARP